MAHAIEEKLEELRELRGKARLGGGEARIEQQHNKGKYTARERVVRLLDQGSFEEFDMFVTPREESRVFQGDGVVTGHGTINGRAVVIVP